MNRLFARPASAFVFLSGALLHAQPTPQQRHGHNFETFSNLHYIQETGDVLGIEVTIVPQYKSAYAIFQCGEGAPTDPVFVPIELTGSHFHFVIRTEGRSCDGIFTGTISARGMNLRTQSETPNQQTYNAGEFIPRHASYWSR